MESFLASRKGVAFAVTATLTLLLSHLGFSPSELPTLLGVSFGDVQNALTDVLWQAVLPAWVGWAWPNHPEEGILDYWRLALSGALAIVAIAALVILF